MIPTYPIPCADDPDPAACLAATSAQAKDIMSVLDDILSSLDESLTGNAKDLASVIRSANRCLSKGVRDQDALVMCVLNDLSTGLQSALTEQQVMLNYVAPSDTTASGLQASLPASGGTMGSSLAPLPADAVTQPIDTSSTDKADTATPAEPQGTQVTLPCVQLVFPAGLTIAAGMTVTGVQPLPNGGLSLTLDFVPPQPCPPSGTFPTYPFSPGTTSPVQPVPPSGPSVAMPLNAPGSQPTQPVQSSPPGTFPTMNPPGTQPVQPYSPPGTQPVPPVPPTGPYPPPSAPPGTVPSQTISQVPTSPVTPPAACCPASPVTVNVVTGGIPPGQVVNYNVTQGGITSATQAAANTTNYQLGGFPPYTPPATVQPGATYNTYNVNNADATQPSGAAPNISLTVDLSQLAAVVSQSVTTSLATSGCGQSSCADSVAAAVTAALQATGGMAANIANAVSNAVSNALSASAAASAGLATALSSAVSNAIANVLSSALSQSDAQSYATSVGNALASAIGNALSNAYSQSQSNAAAVGNAVANAVNQVAVTVNAQGGNAVAIGGTGGTAIATATATGGGERPTGIAGVPAVCPDDPAHPENCGPDNQEPNGTRDWQPDDADDDDPPPDTDWLADGHLDWED